MRPSAIKRLSLACFLHVLPQYKSKYIPGACPKYQPRGLLMPGRGYAAFFDEGKCRRASSLGALRARNLTLCGVCLLPGREGCLKSALGPAFRLYRFVFIQVPLDVSASLSRNFFCSIFKGYLNSAIIGAPSLIHRAISHISTLRSARRFLGASLGRVLHPFSGLAGGAVCH
jgi:hypothetical protein